MDVKIAVRLANWWIDQTSIKLPNCQQTLFFGDLTPLEKL